MKAISLWQPWASLIANGAKEIETRHWPIRHRGPLLIHAAKRKHKGEIVELAEMPDFCAALGVRSGEAVHHLNNLPYGAIIAVVDLVDCVPVERIDGLDDKRYHAYNDGGPDGVWTERCMGNYEPGRFGWRLANVRPIEPIPWKGEQGLFDVYDATILSLKR